MRAFAGFKRELFTCTLGRIIRKMEHIRRKGVGHFPKMGRWQVDFSRKKNRINRFFLREKRTNGKYFWHFSRAKKSDSFCSRCFILFCAICAQIAHHSPNFIYSLIYKIGAHNSTRPGHRCPTPKNGRN